MSAPLVTLEEARRHLRIDSDSSGSPDDADLELKLKAASGAVRNYLKRPWGPYELELDSHGDQVLDSAGYPIVAVDSAGDPILRDEVRAAALLMVGYLFKDRDNDKGGEYEQGYLPRPVTALLYPLRDPALR